MGPDAWSDKQKIELFTKATDANYRIKTDKKPNASKKGKSTPRSKNFKPKEKSKKKKFKEKRQKSPSPTKEEESKPSRSGRRVTKKKKTNGKKGESSSGSSSEEELKVPITEKKTKPKPIKSVMDLENIWNKKESPLWEKLPPSEETRLKKTIANNHPNIKPKKW